MEEMMRLVARMTGSDMMTQGGVLRQEGFKVPPGYENATGNLPITLPDVIELQLEVLNIYSLTDIYDLLSNWNFPCLERLMVQPSGCIFHCLKIIEMNGFYGDDRQMQMVRFFLEKAVKLDTIVLVTPKEGTKGYVRYDEASFRFLHEQLLLLPKASRNARVVVQEH